MSSIIKKTDLTSRKPVQKPENSFTFDAVLKDVGQPKQSSAIKKETTTVRISKETRSKLNSLVQIGQFDSIDALLSNLIESQLITLPAEDKTLYEALIKRNQ